MGEEREDEDQDERGWDRVIGPEDEERLVPREQFEKQYPPIFDLKSAKSAFKPAFWIFLAFLPIAAVVAVLILLGH